MPGLDGTGKLFDSFIAALPKELVAVTCIYPASIDLGYELLLHIALSQCPNNEPYVLLGESFSGPIAIEIASLGPPMLKGLILVNTFVTCPNEKLVNLSRILPDILLSRPPSILLRYLLREHESEVEPFDIVQQVLRSLPGVLIRSRLSAIFSVDVRKLAAQIIVPVCVLQSTSDWVVPRADQKLLVDSLDVSESHQLKGNHFALQTFPKETARAVIGFQKYVKSISANKT